MQDEILSENFTLRLSPSLRARLDALAAADRRPLGDWMRLALEEVADERELQARLSSLGRSRGKGEG